MIGSSTILQGENLTLGGKPISVGSTNIVIDATRYGLHEVLGPLATIVPSLPGLGNEPVSVLPNGNVAIGDSTISVGKASTIPGTPVLMGSKIIAIDGSTYTLPKPSQPALSLYFRNNQHSIQQSHRHRA